MNTGNLPSKIVLAGGSGFIGRIIARKYYDTSVDVVVLMRGNSYRDKNISYVKWDGNTLGQWTKELEGCTAVINLTGKSVNCRYTEKNKREIIDSRVNSTEAIGKAIQNCLNPPKLWINAGSAAIFGNSGGEIKSERSSLGDGFSAQVCKEWEQAFNSMDTSSTRKVFLRIGLVFGKKSWVLTPFITMAKLGLGGTFGKGDQYVSWIHEEDFLNLLEWIIQREDVNGVIHGVSPNPVSNKDFMKYIRQAYSIPFGIPHPAFLVKAGGAIIGTDGELVLAGRRVVSKVLEEKKFPFKYPHLDVAMKTIAADTQ